MKLLIDIVFGCIITVMLICVSFFLFFVLIANDRNHRDTEVKLDDADSDRFSIE